MGHNFMLQQLRRYDVKPPEKAHKHNFMFDAQCLKKTNSTRWARTSPLWVPSLILFQCAILTLENGAILKKSCTYFLSNFTTSVNFCVIKSKAKIVKFSVNLLLIKRDDFLRAYINNRTSYPEHAGEE